MHLQQAGAAWRCAEKAEAPAPGKLDYQLQAARSVAQIGNRASAMNRIEGIKDANQLTPSQLNAIGFVYSLCDMNDEALYYCQTAVDMPSRTIPTSYTT